MRKSDTRLKFANDEDKGKKKDEWDHFDGDLRTDDSTKQYTQCAS